MSIVLVLIAYSRTVLAEYADSDHDYSTVTKTVLEKLPKKDGRVSYVYDRFLFHSIRNGDLVYLCMAEEAFKRKVVFSMLDEVVARFEAVTAGKNISGMGAGGMKSFARDLEELTDKYSKPDVDKAQVARDEVEETRRLMVQNIERVLERGDYLDNLVDRTSDLDTTAFAFRKRSTALRRRMWWKNMRLMLLLAWIIAMGVYFVIGSVCGFPAFGQCRSSG